MGPSALVGHLHAQPQPYEPQFAADLLTGGMTHGVREQLGDQQLRVVACLFIDLPFVQPVQNSSSRPPDRGVEGGQTERVPERAYRHSGGPIF